MLLAVLSVCSQEELDEDSEDEDSEESEDGVTPRGPSEKTLRQQELKRKILLVGKMQKLFTLLRYELRLPNPLSSTWQCIPLNLTLYIRLTIHC